MFALSGVLQQLGFLIFVCLGFNALLKLQDIIKDSYVANVSFFAECFLLETFTVLISSRFSSSFKMFLLPMDFQHYSLELWAVHSPDYTIKPESLTAAL